MNSSYIVFNVIKSAKKLITPRNQKVTQLSRTDME